MLELDLQSQNPPMPSMHKHWWNKFTFQPHIQCLDEFKPKSCMYVGVMHLSQMQLYRMVVTRRKRQH